MKYLSTLLFSVIMLIPSNKVVVDYYDLTIRLRVPVIINNMTSMGKRLYKYQKLTGTLKIIYGDKITYEVINLVNKNYKLSGKYVTYEVSVDDEVWNTRLNYIGNNKTGKFITPTTTFFIDCDPSYNVGDDEPDNTLLLLLTGYGTSHFYSDYDSRIPRYIRGNVSGLIGCGCRAYGHVSPTRSASKTGPSRESVEDIAAVYGLWSMKFKYRRYE